MQVQEEINKNNNSHIDDSLFDRKVDLVTTGLVTFVKLITQKYFRKMVTIVYIAGRK